MRRRLHIILGLAALMTGLSAHVAQANHWYRGEPPNQWPFPMHMHAGSMPSFPFRNDVNENGTLTSQTEYARADWANDTRVDLYNVSSFSNFGVHALDGHYGRTLWSGLAHPYCPCDSNQGHVAYYDNYLNLTYLTDPNTGLHHWEYKRAIACQEIGHSIGAIGHAAPSCMGATYFDCRPGGPSPCTNVFDLTGRRPREHDFEHIGFMYGSNHPNHWYFGPW